MRRSTLMLKILNLKKRIRTQVYPENIFFGQVEEHLYFKDNFKIVLDIIVNAFKYNTNLGWIHSKSTFQLDKVNWTGQAYEITIRNHFFKKNNSCPHNTYRLLQIILCKYSLTTYYSSKACRHVYLLSNRVLQFILFFDFIKILTLLYLIKILSFIMHGL